MTFAAVLLGWLLAALVLTVVIASLARAGAQEDELRGYGNAHLAPARPAGPPRTGSAAAPAADPVASAPPTQVASAGAG